MCNLRKDYNHREAQMRGHTLERLYCKQCEKVKLHEICFDDGIDVKVCQSCGEITDYKEEKTDETSN